ncbi:hypothetical protein [Streptomyces sp. 2A115]|uniref:hypothetical protein n=1 Tax=Streptomyces sp. 2A115 TaxID=3457439 RepID=UPI003FD29D23
MAHLTQILLPHTRTQRSGTIVNISSMGGKLVTPQGGWYHAKQVRRRGAQRRPAHGDTAVRYNVVVVEPGSIRTEWGAIAAEKLKETSSKGAYSTLAEGVAKPLAASSQPDARMTSAPSVSAGPSSRSPRSAARAPATGSVSGSPQCSYAGCCRTAPSTSSSAVPSASDPIWFQERSVLCAPAPTRVRQVVTTAGGRLLFSGVSRLNSSIHRHELQEDPLTAVHQL